jgi:hypothetical protein
MVSTNTSRKYHCVLAELDKIRLYHDHRVDTFLKRGYKAIRNKGYDHPGDAGPLIPEKNKRDYRACDHYILHIAFRTQQYRACSRAEYAEADEP